MYDDYELRKLVKNNRKLFLSWNFWCCTEFYFSRPAFKNVKVSLYVGLIRFVLWLQIFVKMFVGLIYNGCRYSELRYRLLDWTVLYPAKLRKTIAITMLTPAFTHVLMKSSLFWPAPLKPPLQDDLTEYPQLEKLSTVEQEKSVNSKPKTGFNYRRYSKSESTLSIKGRRDSYFNWFLRHVDSLFMKLIPECNKFNDSTRTKKNQTLRRDVELWLLLSRSS